ncbi:MAG: carboxypeptidase regulatory-like domain-containing protein [Solirubrobacteraceae bacterium]|jgi:type II secretory pathway pseudopilin PulG
MNNWMLDPASRARAYRPGGRRFAARAAGEAGDTMIEVVVATLIVALVAAAIFTGLSSVADISGAQRHQVQANALAQQDEERLRGLNVTTLAATEPSSSGCTTLANAAAYGNACYTQTTDNETYTIQSTATFVSAANGATSCSSGGTATADDIETASSVTWGNGSNDGRKPVIEHSLIAPPAGGSLIASVTASSSSPIAGATISVASSSGGGTQTINTDSNGCAVFGGLADGYYTVSVSDSGYLAENASQSYDVVPGTTTTASFNLGLPGTLTANFTTAVLGVSKAIPWDTFSIADYANNNVVPLLGPYGTVATLSPPTTATVSSASQTLYPTTYYAYAGNCTADDPGATIDPTATVPAASTQANGATVTVTVPSVLLQLETTYHTVLTQLTTPTYATLPYTVSTYDSCPTAVSRVTGKPAATTDSALTNGWTTVYPVPAPYGASMQVCFYNATTNTNTGALPSGSTQISNTSMSGSTATTLQLTTTSSAVGANAVFSNRGACP